MQLIQRIRCRFLGKHRYLPVMDVRQWFTSKGKYHIVKEFQFQCHCCKKKTGWKRWKHLPEFEQQNNITW